MKLKMTALGLIAILALSACDTTIPGGPTVPTVPTLPTTTTTPIPSPVQVSGLKLDRVENVNGNTYNAYFSWEASPTPNVKYCVSTTSVGSTGNVEGGCTWNNQYLSSDTQRGFGLMFDKDVDYKVSVTTIDSNNQLSPVTTLTWRIPTAVSPATNLKLDRVENVNGNTYNVFFSWDASTTPNVKYCVSTTSVGSTGNVEGGCTWNNQYLSSDTHRGFGLVFEKGYTYKFQVTAIDANNNQSVTNSIIWQLP